MPAVISRKEANTGAHTVSILISLLAIDCVSINTTVLTPYITPGGNKEGKSYSNKAGGGGY